MKAKDISKHYGIDNTAFSNWLKGSGHATKSGFGGGLDLVDGQDVETIVGAFKAAQAEQRDNADRQQADEARAVQEKQQALASMLITSGFNFDGYTVTKYSGYISGDDVTQIARDAVTFTQGTGSKTGVGVRLSAAMVQIRRNALAELKEAAWALDCNAIIGVDFDYLTLEPETQSMSGNTKYMPYVVCVTANGNAVKIEKAASAASTP
jgi:uncharacterized protein YbjQ (UPF0145 family)